MTGVGEWAVSFNKAREAVGNLTLEEKVCLLKLRWPDVTCADYS